MKRLYGQSHFSRHTTAIRVDKMSWRITNAYIHGCRITNSAGRRLAIQFHNTSKKELAGRKSALQDLFVDKIRLFTGKYLTLTE
jgi:hypothetical protein